MAFYTITCKEDNCEKKHHAKDLCRLHYLRFKKYGSTEDTRHHKAGTPEHIAWCRLRQRCNNENDKSYSYYGARGISVCKRWDEFENFIEDMGNRPTNKHSIDRIDNDGNYEPTNCRWVTKAVQNYNKRYRDSYRGVYQTGSKWLAKINHNAKDVYLGTFITKEEAAKAWNEAALKYRGEEAALNTIGVGYAVL